MRSRRNEIASPSWQPRFELALQVAAPYIRQTHGWAHFLLPFCASFFAVEAWLPRTSAQRQHERHSDAPLSSTSSRPIGTHSYWRGRYRLRFHHSRWNNQRRRRQRPRCPTPRSFGRRCCWGRRRLRLRYSEALPRRHRSQRLSQPQRLERVRLQPGQQNFHQDLDRSLQAGLGCSPERGLPRRQRGTRQRLRQAPFAHHHRSGLGCRPANQ